MSAAITIDSISQVHDALGLAKPKHPLITVVWSEDMKAGSVYTNVKVVNNLYQISFKTGACGILRYGRNSYDFQEGSLICTAPGQVVQYESQEEAVGDHVGWSLLFHPDLFRKSHLAQKIDDYGFFDYASNEALHLSYDERTHLEELLNKIASEYSQNLDRHSLHLINSNIEMLLDYCLRYYDRQFLTRTDLNKDVLSKFERLLKSYYESAKSHDLGVPTLPYCANELSLSPTYLSDLLKKETGKSAQEHIHLFIIGRAKTKLLNSSKTISEIAYGLGFDYPQHFSSLFKSKTGISPSEFRVLN